MEVFIVEMVAIESDESGLHSTIDAMKQIPDLLQKPIQSDTTHQLPLTVIRSLFSSFLKS